MSRLRGGRRLELAEAVRDAHMERREMGQSRVVPCRPVQLGRGIRSGAWVCAHARQAPFWFDNGSVEALVVKCAPLESRSAGVKLQIADSERTSSSLPP